ncbi:NUDIX domain-containing protein [Amnibacterium soli]|uniref:NUDIX domain-containing protein n=1 Tax=Amnibacterium soli TaxID=1282736 RepID=A0ABP8Z0B2_9MICO
MTSADRPLDSFPRPNVAVDTAVLTVLDDELSVVLSDTQGDLRLPGTFLRPGERLRDAVQRSLDQKAGIRDLVPEQLDVFDDPERDTRGWVLSVAHFAVVPSRHIDSASARVVPVRGIGPLPFDHEEIVRQAVGRLRREYDRTADPRGLAGTAGTAFTLRDLQRLHEAVAGEELRRETFRKRMEPQVEPTGETLRGVVGKPPRLFRRKQR